MPAWQGGRAPLGSILTGQNGRKPAKGGVFPRLVESTPPVRGGLCAVRFSALGPVGSHRWLTSPMDGTYFYVSMFFYPQGLTLVSRCSQRSQAWLPAAGTPLLRGRPGYGNHPAIGPAAMVVWYGGSDRSHSKGHGPNTNLTHSQPSTPGGYLGGNALSGFWFLLTEQKEPPAGSVPARLASPSQEKKNHKTTHIPDDFMALNCPLQITVT